MKKGSKKHKKGYSENEDDEHIVSIIATLLRAFDSSEQGKLWNRVVDKFRENDYAKVERLLEMHEKYSQKVKNCDYKIIQEKSNISKEGEEIDSADEEDFYLQRIDAGLFTLQRINYIIAVLCQAQSQIKEKVQQLLTLQDNTFEEVKRVLIDYAQGMVIDSNEDAKTEKNKIISLANDLTSVYQ
eukprot:TRINITY_DN15702_c0_g1_i1.p1 TRINITY_DN15702_c0_g1~~TRINITY_DN15702_c0_g1_i1.p1  ORF type:complete len:185 (+),score=45.94 TRINITY_DN15702_c0_g1_i1:109-663(+)